MTVGVVVLDIAISAGGLGIDYRSGQIGHSVTNGSPPFGCLCCPGAKLRGWAPSLVLRIGVYRGYNENLIIVLGFIFVYDVVSNDHSHVAVASISGD